MKLLASDFDGTLFFEKSEIQYRAQDIEAISRFQKAGHLFGLCTGRPLKGVTAFIPDDLTFDFYILNSGALILDKTYREIFKKNISLEVLFEAMEAFPDLGIFIVTDDTLYIYPNQPSFASELVSPLQSKKQLIGKEILSFSFHLEDESKAEMVLDRLSRIPQIDVYQNRCDIDCVAKGCSKQTGIKAIQELFGLEKQDIACIGDSYNDLPMLTYADHGFTFTYSPEAVQKKAQYVVSDIAECIDILMAEAA